MDVVVAKTSDQNQQKALYSQGTTMLVKQLVYTLELIYSLLTNIVLEQLELSFVSLMSQNVRKKQKMLMRLSLL